MALHLQDTLVRRRNQVLLHKLNEQLGIKIQEPSEFACYHTASNMTYKQKFTTTPEFFLPTKGVDFKHIARRTYPPIPDICIGTLHQIAPSPPCLISASLVLPTVSTSPLPTTQFTYSRRRKRTLSSHLSFAKLLFVNREDFTPPPPSSNVESHLIPSPHTLMVIQGLYADSSSASIPPSPPPSKTPLVDEDPKVPVTYSSNILADVYYFRSTATRDLFYNKYKGMKIIYRRPVNFQGMDTIHNLLNHQGLLGLISPSSGLSIFEDLILLSTQILRVFHIYFSCTYNIKQ